MEFAFFGFGIELMLVEASKYFSDVILMGCEVLGIYKDVIQITHMSSISVKMLLTNCWKAASALVRPSGITNHS
jgi:hypothetical protein